MFTLIKMDLKQRIKSPLTWFIILILCMISLLNIMDKREERSYRPFSGHDINRWERSYYDWGQFYDERDRISIPVAVYSNEMLTKTMEDAISANRNNDIREVTRLLTFNHLLRAKGGFVTNNTIGNPYFNNEALEMWDEVSGGIPYENINFFPTGNAFGETKYYQLLYAKYYYQLYVNDLEPIYSDDVNNITYLYDYFFNVVPLFVLIIPILFIYNIINKEKNSGSLKLVLTQSISRWKYYISKWVSGVVHVISMLILPPAFISTILGLKDGFVSFKYPTLFLKNTMTSFGTVPNYLDAIKMQEGHLTRFGFRSTTFSYFAPSHRIVIHPYHIYPHERVDVIPFYQYLLMVLLLTVLFVAFAVALVQLISAIINKEIISFVGATGIFAVGTLISSPFKEGKNLNLSPFTMEHGSRIVIGTYNISALGSTLILLASTLLLLVIGCRYFKTKEI